MIAISHQLEHGLQAPIAAITGAAKNRLRQGDTHQSRVAKAEHIRPFDHQHRNAP